MQPASGGEGRHARRAGRLRLSAGLAGRQRHAANLGEALSLEADDLALDARVHVAAGQRQAVHPGWSADWESRRAPPGEQACAHLFTAPSRPAVRRPPPPGVKRTQLTRPACAAQRTGTPVGTPLLPTRQQRTRPSTLPAASAPPVDAARQRMSFDRTCSSSSYSAISSCAVTPDAAGASGGGSGGAHERMRLQPIE